MITRRAGDVFNIEIYDWEGFVDRSRYITSATLKVWWAEGQIIIESRYGRTKSTLDDYDHYEGDMDSYVRETIKSQKAKKYGLV